MLLSKRYFVICLSIYLIEYVISDPYDFNKNTNVSGNLPGIVTEMELNHKQECNVSLFGISRNKSRLKAVPIGRMVNSNFQSRLIFYFVFDVSESMKKGNFKKSVEFAKAVVEKVGISETGTRAGMLTFSSKVHTGYLPLWSETKSVLNVLEALEFIGEGESSPKSALTAIREKYIPISEHYFLRKGNSSLSLKFIIFFFTNGQSNREENPEEEATILKGAGVEIYCIVFRGSVRQDILKSIASEPKEEHIFILKRYVNILDQVEDITRGITDSSDLDSSPNINGIMQEVDTEKEFNQKPNLREHHGSTSENMQNETKVVSFNDFPGRLIFYFVFDISKRIGEANFKKSVEFTKMFVKKVGLSENGTRAGIFVFSSQTETLILPYLLETTEDALAALDELNFRGGGPALKSELNLVSEDHLSLTEAYRSKKGIKTIIFMFTDGKTNRDGDPTEVAESMKQAGVEIFCFGLTNSVLHDSLNKVASEPKERHVFMLQNYTNMSHLVEEITDGTTDSYEADVEKETQQEQHGALLGTRQNETKTISFRRFPGRLVFNFVFDVSRRFGEVNFKKSVKFAKAFIKRIAISKNETRLGVVTFSSKAETQFVLFGLEHVIDALDELNFTGGGGSVLKSALTLIREEHIPIAEHYLSKQEMKFVVFLFTNGKPNRAPNEVAELLKQAGVEIFCIGITNSAHRDSLSKIASEPKEEHVFILENYATPSYLVEEIIDGKANYSKCGPNPGKLKDEIGRGKIVGGREIIEPWPWMAAIYFLEQDSHLEFYCGGSIIHESFISTAAHCLFTNKRRKREEVEIIVKLGLTDVRNQSSLQESEVEKISIHPNYRFGSRYDYDIALLQLKTPIRFNSLIRPICLPPRESSIDTNFYQPGEFVVAIGWGLTRTVGIMEQAGYQPPDKLKEIILPIQSPERCGKRKTIYFSLPENAFTDRMFCAGDGKGGNDTCFGDSGGPVMQSWLNEDGNIYWTQIGIVSWGIGCGLPNTYGYYTHVQKLMDWVASNISPKNESVQ